MNTIESKFITWYKNTRASRFELLNFDRVQEELIRALHGIGNNYCLRAVENFWEYYRKNDGLTG